MAKAKRLIVGGLEWRLRDDVDTDKLRADIKDGMESKDGKVLEVKLEAKGEVLLLNCGRSQPYVYLAVEDYGAGTTGGEGAEGIPSVRRVP